ncbi:ATP-dependent Clp protease ATP-binding subunit [Candidatus Parcubacteria bacterium]|nr:ATP-dependent Clp protease ATP-binding subunit [Candidatus Parcubacteria bacterium]
MNLLKDKQRGRAGIFTGDYFLYWGGAMTAKDVPIKKIKRLWNKFIDAALILFGLFGILNLFYQVYLSGARGFFHRSFWLTPNIHLLIFFLALFGLLYFASRITRAAHFFENPLKISAGEKFEIKTALPEELKNYKQIDVARSFSLHSEEALEEAIMLAKKEKSAVLPEYLFLTLLNKPKMKILFGRLGIPIKSIKDRVLRHLSHKEGRGGLDVSVLQILLNTYITAALHKNKKARSNILCLEVVKASAILKEILYDLNINEEKLENVVKWVEIQDKLRARYAEFKQASVFRPRGKMNRAMTAVQTPVLDRFSEDITFFARRGAIDFCIGREESFKNIFRIIESKSRGVVLVGERGVGKSAIIDGVAELMIKEDVPKDFQDKRLIRLSLSEILGGATGEEAGKKLMAVMTDVANSGSIVLDIPNLEYFLSGDGISLAALLAEELNKVRVPVLASTTPEGYKRVVEETALSGIFERVEVPEPDKNLAIQILEAESAQIEYQTGVYFSYDALAAAVNLSDKYLHDRYLPEKAVAIIKEAGLAVKSARGVNSLVNQEDIAKIVSEKSKIPVSALTEGEKEKLLKLEEVIHNRIIGQEEAVDAVSRALRRARAGMESGKRPIANFLFLGPTGVGKTELAKTIAEVYFGNEEAMVRLDMSEYQEKQSVYRMIGKEGESGYLTEAIRKSPYALLLLDELEKAHPDILNLFLQVMEDGRLTDGKGKTIDFTNIILVATSNAGSDFIAREIKAGTKALQIKEMLVDEKLSQYFRPEFLNRFDGVVVFRPLHEDEIVKIAGLLIIKIAKKMETKGIELVVEEKALKELAKLGFDPKFGARPLRRVIAREIEDRLANMLLGGKVKRRDKIIFHSLSDIEIEQGRKI